jgi:hypothetical protein
MTSGITHGQLGTGGTYAGAPAVLEAEEPRPVMEVEDPRPEVEAPTGCRGGGGGGD